MAFDKFVVNDEIEDKKIEKKADVRKGKRRKALAAISHDENYELMYNDIDEPEAQ